MIQVNLEVVHVIIRDKGLNPFYYFQPQENAQLYFDSFKQFKEHCVGRIEPNRACRIELPNWNGSGFIASVDAVYIGWEECKDEIQSNC